MKRIIFGFLLLFSFFPSFGQDFTLARFDQPTQNHKWVNIPSGRRIIRSFIVLPEVSYKAPAILLIHENRGLTKWVRSFADQLSNLGFVVIAPDLLSGMGPSGGGSSSFLSADEVRTAIYGLDPSQVSSELSSVLQYVSSLPASNGKSVVIGFSWGGSQAFRFASDNSQISASFVFYGTGPKDKAAYRRIQAPIYGFYGSLDERVNSTVSLSQSYMRELGKTFEPVFYMGAGHAFVRRADLSNAPSSYLRAKEAALQRLSSLLLEL